MFQEIWNISMLTFFFNCFSKKIDVYFNALNCEKNYLKNLIEFSKFKKMHKIRSILKIKRIWCKMTISEKKRKKNYVSNFAWFFGFKKQTCTDFLIQRFPSAQSKKFLLLVFSIFLLNIGKKKWWLKVKFQNKLLKNSRINVLDENI